jgi:hypothetical protein
MWDGHGERIKWANLTREVTVPPPPSWKMVLFGRWNLRGGSQFVRSTFSSVRVPLASTSAASGGSPSRWRCGSSFGSLPASVSCLMRTFGGAGPPMWGYVPFAERWRIITTSSSHAPSKFLWSAVREWLGCTWNPPVLRISLGFSITKWGNPSGVLWMACAALC